MSKLPNYYVVEVEDEHIRENFRKLQEFTYSPLFRGEWEFYQITVPFAISNFRHKHQFKFVPQDTIQLSIKGAGTLTWNYDKFDKNFLDLTTTGPCVVRAFIGRYSEGI